MQSEPGVSLRQQSRSQSTGKFLMNYCGLAEIISEEITLFYCYLAKYGLIISKRPLGALLKKVKR